MSVMTPVVKPGDMFADPTWVEPTEGSKMHKLPPSAERADLRSETPAGFARAVFLANAPHLKREAAEAVGAGKAQPASGGSKRRVG